ncbi:hypothetical protein D3C77_761450 [compost metagenome]
MINRHEAYSVQELNRILKPGGLFITQQVGGQNNRGLLGEEGNLGTGDPWINAGWIYGDGTA